MNILVTCQANKNNYTIAFEGSTVMGDDSDYLDNGTFYIVGQIKFNSMEAPALSENGGCC